MPGSKKNYKLQLYGLQFVVDELLKSNCLAFIVCRGNFWGRAV